MVFLNVVKKLCQSSISKFSFVISSMVLILEDSTKKLCTVMLDTVGPELQVIKNSEKAITLKIDGFLTFTLNQDKKEASSIVLLIIY
ncbi:hypothetical protein Bca101_067206 [Brassica carinata]